MLFSSTLPCRRRKASSATPWLQHQSLDALDILLGWLMLLLCLPSGLSLSLYKALSSISYLWFSSYIRVYQQLCYPCPRGHPRAVTFLLGFQACLKLVLLGLCSLGTSQMLNFPVKSLCQVHTVVLAQLVSGEAHPPLPPSGRRKQGVTNNVVYAHPCFDSALSPAALLVFLGSGWLLAPAGGLSFHHQGPDLKAAVTRSHPFQVRMSLCSCKSSRCQSLMYFDG